jgi:hypothetical protein
MTLISIKMTVKQRDGFLIWDQEIFNKFASLIQIYESLPNQRGPNQA